MSDEELAAGFAHLVARHEERRSPVPHLVKQGRYSWAPVRRGVFPREGYCVLCGAANLQVRHGYGWTVRPAELRRAFGKRWRHVVRRIAVAAVRTALLAPTA